MVKRHSVSRFYDYGGNVDLWVLQFQNQARSTLNNSVQILPKNITVGCRI